MSDHHFNPGHAEKFGVNAAILLHNLIHWINHNKAAKTNFHDGHYWTYNSVVSWAKLFPYLSKKQVRTALETLREEGVIIVGNYNSNPKDQKLWYALADEVAYLPKNDKDRAPQGKSIRASDGNGHALEGEGCAPQGNSYIGTDNNPYNNPDTNTPLSPAGSGEVESENVFEKENTNTGLGGGAAEERAAKFRAELFGVGRTIYTKAMLERFYDYWTELDRGKKPKMRFEKQKVFETKKRLNIWATKNLDKIQCYLTVEEKTIAEKKLAFKQQLEPHLGRYGRDMLNAFYQYWSQAENVPNPTRLAWECMEFWDLANRLASWQSRNNKPKH